MPQILPAQSNGAGGHIPEAGDQLGDGGLAGAGGPYKGGHGPGGDGERYIVEHLLVCMVAERHMGELNIPALELRRRFPVVLLRSVQNGIHRAHDGAHLSETVHKVHGGQQGPGNAQGQDDGGDKGLDGQAPSGIEEPAHRQNGDHGGGRDGTGQRDRHLAALHPVVEVGGVGLYAVGEAGIGLLALVKRLDDLNAADVLHNGAVHGLGGFDRALVLLAVAGHDRHHESHAHRDGHQTQKGHPPVQHEQIDQDAHRSQHIGGHLRQKMGQRPLHALHLVHDDLFHLAAGGVQNRTQRHLRQFLQHFLPDRFQDSKGGLVGLGQGQGIQGGPEQKAHKRHCAPYQVVLCTLLPFQQAQDDLRCGEVREHPKQYPHHSGQDRPLQAALLSLSQLPQTEHGTLLFHDINSSFWLVIANFCTNERAAPKGTASYQD